jgi:hypothetical protein
MKKHFPASPHAFCKKKLGATSRLVWVFLLLAACSGGATETVPPSSAETPTPLQLPSETSTTEATHPESWELYTNSVYGYQLYLPPSATLTSTGVEGVTPSEVPEGVSLEEYKAQLQAQLSDQLCVTIRVGVLGYIQISAPTNAGFRYAICGLTGVGAGEMTEKSEEIDLGGSTVLFRGFELIGSDENSGAHFEVFNYEMGDGTRIEFGSAGPSGTYDEYLTTNKPTILQVLSTLDFSIPATFDWDSYEPPSLVTTSASGDALVFVDDVTIPDGTIFEPGEAFTKTWRLQNAGENNWTPAYALKFDSGDQMGGPAEVLLEQTVPPNQTADLSVELIAPDEPGLYTGYWILRNAQGLTFGLGQDKDQGFFVMIEVREPGGPTPTAGSVSNGSKVTGASVSASPSSYNGDCPATITISGTIKSTGAGSYIYQLEAGSSTPGFTFSLPGPQTATFTTEGTHQLNVSYTLEISDSVNAWARVYISSPNTYRSDQVAFTVSCN